MAPPSVKVDNVFHLYCAREKPWLEGLACSHISERRNNDRIVSGGTLTQRLARKQLIDQGNRDARGDFDPGAHGEEIVRLVRGEAEELHRPRH